MKRRLFFVAALVLCVITIPLVQAGEANFREVKGIEGFATFAATRGVESASVPGPEGCAKADGRTAQAEAKETMAWGKARLEELQYLPSRAAGRETALAEDALAFRDWSLGEPGGGNLLLAVVAEDTAVKLLLQALASGKCSEDGIHRLFAECNRNGLTTEYCLTAFKLEGVDNGWDRDVRMKDAEYIRFGTLLEAVMNDYWEGDRHTLLPPLPEDQPGFGRYNEFHPFFVAHGSLMLARRKIALEVCLTIRDSVGRIPIEREEFIRIAVKHAAQVLERRERLTDIITPHEVWRYWSEALKEANRE